MTDYYQQFREYCEEQDLFQEGDQVLLGLSGGADSMCLLLLLEQLSEELSLKLTAVHVNHGLRGEEADADEVFVKEFCRDRNIPCAAVHADVKGYAKEHGLSLEEAGRIARYQTFGQVAKKLAESKQLPSEASVKVAVAHHLNDNAETILLNLVRGTGLNGLQGMQPLAERFGMTIVRPLLCMERGDCETYLEERGISYRTDSSNLEENFARNKMRLQVLPVLHEINSKSAAHINDTANMILKAQSFIKSEAKRVYQRLADPRDEGLYMDLSRFLEQDIVIQEQLVRMMIEEFAGSLKDISRVHIRDVLKLTKKQSGKQVDLPYNLVAIRSYSNLILRKQTQKETVPEVQSYPESVEDPETAFYIDPTQLSFEPTVYQLWEGMQAELTLVHVNAITRQLLVERNEYTKAFDCAKIKGNLVFRPGEPHDEIQFFGGRKNLRRFFIDEKIPKEERSRIPVLADEQQILWIIGHRISESYKITELTNLALQVRLLPQT